MSRTIIKMVAAMTVLVLTGGCGVYSASSGRVDENLKHVHVQYLENLTSEPNLGVDLTDAIILALQLDNTLRVVDEGEADTIISGKATRYSLREVATTEELTVNEFQVQIAVVLTMAARSTGEKIFDKKRFTGTGNFNLDDSSFTEDDARKEAAEEIVRDILAQVVSDW